MGLDKLLKIARGHINVGETSQAGEIIDALLDSSAEKVKHDTRNEIFVLLDQIDDNVSGVYDDIRSKIIFSTRQIRNKLSHT